MSVWDFLKILRERWIIVVVTLLLSVGAAYGVYATTPPSYSASVSLYVSSQTGETPQAAYQGAQLSAERVASYTELVRSTRVTAEVVKRLNLPMTPDALSSKISAKSTPDSVLIDVNVSDADPQRAASIANGVGSAFTDLVAELERPVNPKVTAPVAIRVVEPAVPPAGPSGPGLSSALLPGLAVGLILGVAAALIRNATDTSVKTAQQLAAVTRAPNLGVIQFDRAVVRKPLTVHESPRSARSEAFRRLRTNLQFVDVDSPPKIVVVTSAMSSEGKSTSLANLAIALASAGVRVLVIDADLRRPKMADLFGLEGSVGLTSVLTSQVSVSQAIQRWGLGGFDVLASGPLPPNPSELLASRQMSRLLAETRSRYDVILIDSPPLLPVTDAAVLAQAADGALLVCRARKTSRGQLVQARQALDSVSAHLLGTTLNMSRSSGSGAEQQYGGTYFSPELDRAAGVGTPPAAQEGASRREAQVVNARVLETGDETRALPVTPSAQVRVRPPSPGNGHASSVGGPHSSGNGSQSPSDPPQR